MTGSEKWRQVSGIFRDIPRGVGPGHVKESEKHWSKRPTVQNNLKD